MGRVELKNKLKLIWVGLNWWVARRYRRCPGQQKRKKKRERVTETLMNKRTHQPQYILRPFPTSYHQNLHLMLMHVSFTFLIPQIYSSFSPFLFPSNLKFINKSNPKLFSSLIIVLIWVFIYIYNIQYYSSCLFSTTHESFHPIIIIVIVISLQCYWLDEKNTLERERFWLKLLKEKKSANGNGKKKKKMVRWERRKHDVRKWGIVNPWKVVGNKIIHHVGFSWPYDDDLSSHLIPSLLLHHHLFSFFLFSQFNSIICIFQKKKKKKTMSIFHAYAVQSLYKIRSWHVEI